jgi:glycosyltransferase involved in cell wall biosynthesis
MTIEKNIPTANVLQPEILLSAVMPCLNEAETIGACVRDAMACIRQMGIEGEVIVADNGSTDGSQAIARECGARIVDVPLRGYGAALAGGFAAARGEIIVMADSDCSYDWGAMGPLVAKVLEGNDLVMGNRFKGGIKPGAMPLLHRYVGNPVLSFLGRLFFKTPIGDFHCGMRAFLRESILKLNLQTPGMEFASEMVVKAVLRNLSIAEMPVVLSPDGRSRGPHLRAWRDGWRHLRFLLLYSPRWLFLFPGVVLFLVGGLGMATISHREIVLAGLGLDIHTLAYAGAALTLGSQMIFFAIFTKLVGQRAGWLPRDERLEKIVEKITLEAGLGCAAVLFLGGLFLTWHALSGWSHAGFAGLDPRVTMRSVIPAVTAMSLAGEVALGSFFLEAVRIRQSA